MQKRQYIYENCLHCGKELKIRKEYIKVHKKLCRSCSKKQDWLVNTNYKEKCISSHRGHTPSNKMEQGVASLNMLFANYRRAALKRKLVFEITKEDFKIITKKNCFYCGKEPSQIPAADKNVRVNNSWIYNDIDRLDSLKGYINNNVVSCCKDCNYAKQSLSYQDFIQLIKKIYKNHIECDTVGSREISDK